MRFQRKLRTLCIGCAIVCAVTVPFGITFRQSRLNAELVSAVERGNVAASAEALRNGADPNARQIYANRPGNPVQVVEWVLRKDNIFWHVSPVLSAACESPNPVPLAKMLLEHGADPNGKDKIGFTALLECVEQDNADLVRLLLEHGTQVDARTRQGNTALMLLADNQFATVHSLPALIAHRANLHLRNDDGKTALQLARESHHVPAIKILEEAEAKK